MYAQTLIDRTITINAQTLVDIRNSINNPSSEYYDQFLVPYRSDGTQQEVEELNPPSYAIGTDYEHIRNSVRGYLKSAMFGTNQLSAISGINGELYSISDDYLNILEDSFKDTSVEGTSRALHLSYLAISTSMLYDCLYYYYSEMDTSNVYHSNLSKLKNIMIMCKDLMLETDAYYDSIFNNPGSYPNYNQYKHGYWAHDLPSTHQPDYPGFSMIQYRLGMYGALGLTALLLSATDPGLHDEMSSIVSEVDDLLGSANVPVTFLPEYQKTGMLDFHTSKSGAYFESMGYMGFLMQQLAPYFVARKRLSNGSVNYFNNPKIVSWTCDMAQKISPSGEDWAYNDSQHLLKTNPCIAYSFYQNTSNTLSLGTKCSWYLRTKRDLNGILSGCINYGNALPYSDFFVLYFSSPYKQPKILNSTEVPSTIGSGSWSNSEFSVLSKIPFNSSLTSDTYRLKPTMQIVHENSFSGYHGQADQSSFSFFYKGNRVLIDPGYYRYGWTNGRTYCRSPYAHNMLLVYPSATVLSNLVNNLDGVYRPISAFNYYQSESVTEEQMIEDPCIRDYFQKSPDLDFLKLRLGYRNADDYNQPLAQQNVIARLSRSFIRDDDLFVVYDDVESIDDENFYDYWNLLHFGKRRDSADDVVLNGNVFSITQGYDTDLEYVDIACGSYSPNYSIILDTSLNLPNDPSLGLQNDNHLQGRQVAAGVQHPRFLTIIAPRYNSASRVILSQTEEDASFCTVISGISRTDPTINTITYIGCTNGEDQAIELSNATIETNGRMFVATRYLTANPIALDRSMVLLDGDYLRANDTALFELFNGEVKGVTSTYKGDELAVVFHGTAISFPRFKIYRSGADPSLFSAIMRTQLEPQIPEPIPYPDDPEYRYFTTNIVQSLAYDDHYFYVNYSWEDLNATGLINDELVIVKGEIPSTNLNTDLNIQGDVSITGSITINNCASMDVHPNSSMLVSDGVGISNHGALNISGGASRTVSIGSASQQWSGIITYRDGSLICDGTVVTGANTGIQIRGNSTISNSEISDCHQGISIETGTPFSIDGSLIQNNTYGIVISNNYTTSDLGHIQNNEITQNGIGMLLYNSNTKIALNDIHNNKRAGLYLVRGSEPIVKSCNISFTEHNGLSRPEIRLESDSYPIIDDARNDINADGLGYSLFYDSTGRIKQLMARNNYWGSTNPFGIRQWMYPLGWDVVYDPYSTEPNTFFPHVYDNLFKQALAAEESGDTALAKQLYSTIVVTEPDSLYALQSLGRLNSIYSDSPGLLSELRTLYDAYLVACDDSILVKNAQIKSIMIERFDGQYQQALQEYDLQLQLSTTELDSLLCRLDIAYTLEDMYYDDLGKGSYSGLTYLANGLNITSLKDARQTVEQLWGDILAKSDLSDVDNVPVPTKLDVTNYPNPFNPSTTIALSIPEEGIVRLSVYNTRGQRVRELINGSLPRGFHKVVWDGKDNGNRSVSSGLYFVRIETGRTSTVRKVMMLK
ncbi:MAG: right-handed parallel beta-helix repeat-containing protein [Candidatus Cloacimonetes bacterium]|nr:right-handed parallel beta-helix repeat-containing protein [Candidatus Cloacimonadota bacterium]MCK9334724.1 right-handed parallel beta-helix repeat-containing protein [Candidatus Cloacimonadota bacterium]